MFVVTLVALGIGTGLGAVAHSIGLLIVARLIQGAGGGVLPLAFGIIRDEFPREKVAGAIGLSSAMIAVGSGFGITIAGPIVAHLGYHWLFIIPLFLIIPAAIATHFLVPRSRVHSGRARQHPGRAAAVGLARRAAARHQSGLELGLAFAADRRAFRDRARDRRHLGLGGVARGRRRSSTCR